jgi:Flp pilus assembly protein TadD
VAGGLGVVSVAVVVALSALAWRRSQVWRSEESLWRDTVAQSPRKVRPKLQLARALAALGPAYETEQVRLLEEAARLAPRDPDVRTERGVYFLQRGDPQRALDEFQTALDEGAEEPQAMANRGAALYMLGRIGEAVRDFESALARDGCNFDARNNLILVRRAAGDAEAARQLAVAPEGCRFSKKQQLALEAARP